MPNIELLKRLRTRFLRMRHSEHFDITEVAIKTECGTAMCIAGHTLDLQGYKVRFVDGEAAWFSSDGVELDDDPLDVAQRELELSREATQNFDHGLFYDFSIKTPKQAAQRIEKLIAESVDANAARAI